MGFMDIINEYRGVVIAVLIAVAFIGLITMVLVIKGPNGQPWLFTKITDLLNQVVHAGNYVSDIADNARSIRPN